uniref:Uncharacterized protein n=1 Tax=Anopheles dirus TaxID=7168 RepID=A0A182NX11_9DIPT
MYTQPKRFKLDRIDFVIRRTSIATQQDADDNSIDMHSNKNLSLVLQSTLQMCSNELHIGGT